MTTQLCMLPEGQPRRDRLLYWDKIGLMAGTHAGTSMDLNMVDQKFRPFEQNLVTTWQNEILGPLLSQLSPDNENGVGM